MSLNYTLDPDTILSGKKGSSGEYANCIGTRCRTVVVVEEPEGSRVFVYGGKKKQEFKKHAASVTGVIHVEDNVVASVDMDGKGVVWNAITGAILNGFQVSGEKFVVFRKIGASRFAVQSESGYLYILSHRSGLNVKEVRKLKLGMSNYIIAAHENIILVQFLQGASSIEKGDGVVIIDAITGNRLGHLHKNKAVICAAVDHWHIVTGCSDARLYIFKNTSKFEVAKTMEMKTFLGDEDEEFADTELILDITFIHSDLLMVTMFRSGVFFISVAKGICNARIRWVSEEVGIISSTILADGRICLGGEFQFHAIYSAPAILRNDIQEYIERNFSTCEIGWEEMKTWKDKVVDLKEEALKIKKKMEWTSAEIAERRNEMEKMKEKIAAQKMEIQKLKEQQSNRFFVLGNLFNGIRESMGIDECGKPENV